MCLCVYVLIVRVLRQKWHNSRQSTQNREESRPGFGEMMKGFWTLRSKMFARSRGDEETDKYGTVGSRSGSSSASSSPLVVFSNRQQAVAVAAAAATTGPNSPTVAMCVETPTRPATFYSTSSHNSIRKLATLKSQNSLVYKGLFVCVSSCLLC